MFRFFLVSAAVAFTSISALAEHSALTPASRMDEAWWAKYQAQLNENAEAQKAEIVLIGDSITHHWPKSGSKSWKKLFGSKKVLNLGVSGDRTQHVIWRLQNGNLKNQSEAKLAVIMIGTNNTGYTQQAAVETAEGVEKIIALTKEACPKAKILLFGVFPRGVEPTDRKRQINHEINEIISKFHDGKALHYLDITKKFLDDKGLLSKEMMPDALHPKEKGYQVWADAMAPKLKELLK